MSDQDFADAVVALKAAKDLERQLDDNVAQLKIAHAMLSKSPGWRNLEFTGEVEGVKGVPVGMAFDHADYPVIEEFGVLVRRWREAQTRAIELFEALPDDYRSLITL